jgi:hypothetical protein
VAVESFSDYNLRAQRPLLEVLRNFYVGSMPVAKTSFI